MQLGIKCFRRHPGKQEGKIFRTSYRRAEDTDFALSNCQVVPERCGAKTASDVADVQKMNNFASTLKSLCFLHT